MPVAVIRVAACLLALALAVTASDVPAQGLLERLRSAREASRQPAAQPPDLPAGTRMLRDLVYGVVVAAGGSFSAEHGIGASKAGYLARYKAGPRYEWMKSIKAALDPSGILNPGKMLATTAGQYNTPERKESP